jgi:hypothetical protein
LRALSFIDSVWAGICSQGEEKMLYRFHFRRGTAGILLLCMGIAILGTGVADYFIRRETARRKNSFALPSLTREKQMAMYGAIKMYPQSLPAATISVGSPLLAYYTNLRTISPFVAAKAFPIGSPVPDFALPDALDGREIHLADFFNHKPVILLFGSFGCDVFCGQLARLNKLHQTYKDRVEFLFVYITDAPHKGLLPPLTPAEQHLGDIPRGLRHFKISFTCLRGNKAIEAAYTPFPERLLIVDRAGRIALDAGLGLPRGWDLDRVESWLKQI